jgi:hypothetical protein
MMKSTAMAINGVEIPRAEIERFCVRNHIRKLSLFGSILTERLRPESDVDVLIEFDEGCTPGFLGLARMERELTGILGRKVDLRTPQDLSRYFRRQVEAGAVLQYEH